MTDFETKISFQENDIARKKVQKEQNKNKLTVSSLATCYDGLGPFPDPNLRLYDIKYTIYHKLYQNYFLVVKIVKNLLFYDFCMCIVVSILMGSHDHILNLGHKFCHFWSFVSSKTCHSPT